MSETAIADTSALIALEKINLLNILCSIYGKILLPEAVLREFGTSPPACHEVKHIESPLIKLLVSDLNLGRGEAEVIALAKETGYRIIMDEQKGRSIARRLELHVTGTIGILLKAEKLNLIESAQKKMRELKGQGFYVSDALLDDIAGFKHQKTDGTINIIKNT